MAGAQEEQVHHSNVIVDLDEAKSPKGRFKVWVQIEFDPGREGDPFNVTEPECLGQYHGFRSADNFVAGLMRGPNPF